MSESQNKPLENFKILVVEDEELIRELLKDELEEAGADVSEAHNGEMALEIIAKSKFDLIITDLRMPGRGGIEMIKSLHESSIDRSNLKIIVVTGNIENSKEELKSYGVAEVFFKPINFRDFLDYVCELPKKS